jgi:hypothetical protein
VRAGTELVVRDRTEPPVEGVFSVCYVNGFQTQPGELDVWPDDVLLDTSTSSRRDAIVKVVSPWIQGCADAGLQAVGVDNLDGFTRSHGALTLEDNLALAPRRTRLVESDGGDGRDVGPRRPQPPMQRGRRPEDLLARAELSPPLHGRRDEVAGVSTFAGTLPTMTLGETCAVTTAPAATTDPAPIVTPGSTVTLAARRRPR